MRELMKNHNNTKLKEHLSSLIYDQQHIKIDKEVDDWNKKDLEDLSKAETYTFTNEELPPNQVNLEDLDVEEGTGDEDQTEEPVYVDLYDEANEEETDVSVNGEEGGLVEMAEEFGTEEIVSTKRGFHR